MERGLVVVTDADRTEQLLREAGELAAGAGAELVLLAIDSDGEYDRVDPDADDLEFSLERAEEAVRSSTQRLAAEAFEGIDVPYTIVGAASEEAELVLDAARKLGCDHLFVAGRRRSPTGKAVFGDVTQQILLSYDGPVTLLLGE